MDRRNRLAPYAYCDTHAKRGWSSRDGAKAAIREMHDSGMRAYRCDAVAGMWHIGHLPPDVRKGVITAREIYGEVR